MSKKPDLDRILDRALEQIRDEALDPSVVRTAAERVRARLDRNAGPSAPEVRAIRSCEDFQALIPAYLDGALSRGRALLLEDHTRDCIACRKALKQARERASRGAEAPGEAARTTRYWPWALAGGLAAAVFFGGIVFGLRFDVANVFLPEAGAHVLIGAVDGALYEVKGDRLHPVAENARFDGGQRLRTAKGSGAVIELADGSTVEMNERTELRVTRRGKDATVHLTRGSVIVEASEQGSGHLFTRTDDCLVGVKGTVFSVTHGTKGSRVSVIEGEVHVDRGRRSQLLRPGDQVTTAANLERIPVEDEIAWSRDAERHVALLRELAELRKEMDEKLPRPELRRSSRLLELAPEGTVIYAAFPNLSETLAEAHRMFRDKIRTSDALRLWWEDAGAEIEPLLEAAVERIRGFGETLGEEIVVTLQKQDGEVQPPVLMAELISPDGFRELLRIELDRLAAEHDDELPIRLVDSPFARGAYDRADHEGILFWIQDDVLVLTFDMTQIQSMASALGSPGSSRFAASSFYDRLADTYDDGVGWLFGADVGSIMSDARSTDGAAFLERMGLLDLEHLIVERHETDGKNVTRAGLSFDRDRRGIAAWLAEPAPMGALDFVSADATGAVAFVVHNPASALEELLDALNVEAAKRIDDVEEELSIDLIHDVAAPLGGELAVALDGPVLPKPAWKIVAEVYDPERLQRTIEWAVDRVNAIGEAEDGDRPLRLEPREAAGRSYWSIASDELGTAAVYTFVDGYLVAAPQQALVDRAIEHRRTGYTLPASERFTSLLPRDGRANFSAVIYQNLGPVLDPLLKSTVGRSAELSAEQKAMLSLGHTEPGLFCVYARRDGIEVKGLEQGGLLGGNLGQVLDLGGLAGLSEALEAAGAGADRERVD